MITAVGGCSEVPGLRSMLISPQNGCRFTYCSLNNEQRNQKGADVTRAPLMCCIVLAHGQLQTNDFIYFVCVFFNRRVLILWTILCCICSLRLTQAQGKAVWRQRMGARLLFFLTKDRKTFQIHADWFSTNQDGELLPKALSRFEEHFNVAPNVASSSSLFMIWGNY